MPLEAHLKRLAEGVEAWNQWRVNEPDVTPDLSAAVLVDCPLAGYNLSGTNLIASILAGADLRSANLERADLSDAILVQANLRQANLSEAVLIGANLSSADLTGADLRRSILETAVLVRAKLADADITSAKVYGIAVWDADLENTKQAGLVITPANEPEIVVDDIEVAQFLYLVRRNVKVRAALNTLTSKLVLLLGSFAEPHKAVLEQLRGALLERHFVPVVFDFAQPARRKKTETAITLAAMARFIIADVSGARSVIAELEAIAPHLRSVPIQLIQCESNPTYALAEDLFDLKRVSSILTYRDVKHLIELLDTKILQWQGQFSD